MQLLRVPAIYLFALVVLLAGQTGVWAQGKVHALIVFDTNAGGGISNGVHANQKNLLRVLWKSFDTEAGRRRIEWRTLSGNSVTPANIYRYYADLESTTDDTLFFFYSGHGGLDETNGHFLAMSNGTVWRDELRGAMLFQKHKQIVIITDACASGADQNPPGPAGEIGGQPANWDVVKHLFLESSGFVDVNSAKPRTFSFVTDRGSYFTSAFCKHLCSPTNDLDGNGDGRVEWGEFLDVVREEVKKNIREEHQSHVNFYLGNHPDRHYEKWVELKNNSRHTIQVRLGVTYVDTATNSFKDWNSGNSFYLLAPGQTIRPSWGNSAVRGSRLLIRGRTPDGRWTWNSGVINMVDPRWGFTAGRGKMTYTYTFGN